jgi:hypothetical protein
VSSSEHFIYIEQQYFITNMDPPGVISGEASHVKEDPSQAENSKIAQVLPPQTNTGSFNPSDAIMNTVNAIRGASNNPASDKPDLEVMRTRFVAIVPKDHKPGDIFHVKTTDPITGNKMMVPIYISVCVVVGLSHTKLDFRSILCFFAHV